MAKLSYKLASIVLLITFLFSFLPVLPNTVQEAEAGGPITNALIGLFNVIGAARRRNRVYREARVTQRDMDTYYDTLIDEARQQLQDREMIGDFDSETRSQLRSYIKMYEALQAEREAVTQMIESEKNDARREFNRSLTREVVGVLIRSPGGQSLIGDIRSTVDELRQAAQAVQAAIAEGRPFDALAQALADKVGDIPILRETAYEVGYAAGQKVDQLLGGVLTRVDEAMSNMQAGMGDALDKINEIDSELARFDETERTPVSLVEEGSPLSNIRGVDRANAAVDVAATAYTNAAIIAGAFQDPSNAEKESMRDRIRDQLLADKLDRLGQVGQTMKTVVCQGVGRGEYIAAMGQLGRTPEEPLNADRAGYLICVDKVSGAIVHAALIGPAKVAEVTTTPDEVSEAEETESVSTEQVPPPPPEEERCSLSGNGDFVLESYQVLSQSSTCEDTILSAGYPSEPMLLWLAIGGRWVVVDSNPEGNVWAWQATESLDGARVDGTARIVGTHLDIEATIDIPRSSSYWIEPDQTRGHALALVLLIPIYPLASRISSKKRRRILLLVITVLVLLLTAQSCDAWGYVYGHYNFPIPENGFPCEVPAENPNLAEMPGSTSNFELEFNIADEDNNIETCTNRATLSGVGILKRDGFYTEDSLPSD
ncbi:MAG: hypothetical protein PVF85_04175 [Anaerolineales bacterium]|jgi:hypothetical protein